jgi:hypothetical protein
VGSSPAVRTKQIKELMPDMGSGVTNGVTAFVSDLSRGCGCPSITTTLPKPCCPNLAFTARRNRNGLMPGRRTFYALPAVCYALTIA